MKLIRALLLFFFLFGASEAVAAATITFTDTSGTELGFIIQIVKVDGATRFEIKLSNPSNTTGQVTYVFPNEGKGDCFNVAAYNQGGVSTWTGWACVGSTTINVSNPPGSLQAKESTTPPAALILKETK